MTSKPTTIATTIEALGGDGPVAEAAGVQRNTVVWWRHRDRIPSDYWPSLLHLAVQQRVALTNDDLLVMSRPRKRRGQEGAPSPSAPSPDVDAPVRGEAA